MPETKKLQQLARQNIRRILDEQEQMSHDLDEKKKKIDMWSKQLNKREALTERERQKLDEDKQKVKWCSSWCSESKNCDHLIFLIYNKYSMLVQPSC